MDRFFLFLAFFLMVAILSFHPQEGEVISRTPKTLDWTSPQVYYVTVD